VEVPSVSPIEMSLDSAVGTSRDEERVVATGLGDVDAHKWSFSRSALTKMGFDRHRADRTGMRTVSQRR
jgi:hypothetical protein